MRVLAGHAGSVQLETDATLDADERFEADSGQGADTDTVISIDGAIVAVVGVELGDRGAGELVAKRAATDLATIASDLGADGTVLVAATHDEAGLVADPAATLQLLDDALPVPSVLVPPRSYPDVLVEGPVHPTALRFRRYDGWLPSAILAALDDESERSAAQPAPTTTSADDPAAEFAELRAQWATVGSTAETLANARLLADDPDRGSTTWTPAGAFLEDALLAIVRERALEAGARPTAVRDQYGGPPSVPPTERAGTVQYGVRKLAGGVRPELTVRIGDDEDLIGCSRTLSAILRGALEQVERPLRTTLLVDAAFARAPLVDAIDDSLDPDREIDGTSFSDPVRLAAIVGVLGGDERRVRPVGTFVAARLDGADEWVLQCAPLGRLDRTMATLAEGQRPILAPPIAPTQLRLLPVGESQLGTCEQFAETLTDDGVRVDIDDHARPVGERIAMTRREGVPYYAVVGPREADAGSLPVTDRRAATERTLSPTAVTAESPTLSSGSVRRQYRSRFVSEHVTQ